MEKKKWESPELSELSIDDTESGLNPGLENGESHS